jgi:hypothetical protein
VRLKDNMNGIDKSFDRRARAIEAKEPEKNGEGLDKWTEALGVCKDRKACCGQLTGQAEGYLSGTKDRSQGIKRSP